MCLLRCVKCFTETRPSPAIPVSWDMVYEVPKAGCVGSRHPDVNPLPSSRSFGDLVPAPHRQHCF